MSESHVRLGGKPIHSAVTLSHEPFVALARSAAVMCVLVAGLYGCRGTPERTLWTAAHSLAGWPCGRLCHCELAAMPGRTRIGPPMLAVYGSVGLDRRSAFWAEKRLALGPGPQESVDDERESHLRDLACGLDRSVAHALPGLGLDFGGHGLPPNDRVGTARRVSVRAAAS